MDVKYTSRKYKFFCGYGNHIFFISKKGILFASGRNGRGQLSLNDRKDRFTPCPVNHFVPKSITQAEEVACGGHHSLFMTRDRRVFFCGRVESFSIRESKKRDPFQPKKLENNIVLAVRVKIPGNEVAGMVYTGEQSCYCLTKQSGSVWAGGNYASTSWELAVTLSPPNWEEPVYPPKGEGGSVQPELSFVIKLKGLKDIVHIALCGTCLADEWAAFLSRSGRIFCLGPNRDNAPIFTERLPPNVTQVTELTYFQEKNIGISWLVTNLDSLYFITPQRQVYVCGKLFQALDGDNEQPEKITIPRLVKEMSGFNVICCGNNDQGMLWKNGEDRVFGKALCEVDGDKLSLFGIQVECDRHTGEIAQLRGKQVEQLMTAYSVYYAICADGSVYFVGASDSGISLSEGVEETSLASTTFAFARRMDLMPRREHSIDKTERLQFLVRYIDQCQFFLFAKK